MVTEYGDSLTENIAGGLVGCREGSLQADRRVVICVHIGFPRLDQACRIRIRRASDGMSGGKPDAVPKEIIGCRIRVKAAPPQGPAIAFTFIDPDTSGI